MCILTSPIHVFCYNECIERLVLPVYVQAQEVKQRGNALFKQGKLEEAAQCYEEAIQLGAGDVTLVASCHQNLAAVHDELVSPSIIQIKVIDMHCICTFEDQKEYRCRSEGISNLKTYNDCITSVSVPASDAS